MALKRHLLVAMTLAGMISGCGGDLPAASTCPAPAATTPADVTPTPAPAPAPSAKSTKTTKKPAPKPTAKPGTTPSTGGATGGTATDPADPGTSAGSTQAPDGRALLEQVKTVTLGSSGLQGMITNYEIKTDKSKIETGKFKLWVQGNNYRLENIAHSRPNNVGSKLLLVYGSPDAKVKPANPLLSLLTVTLPLTDSNLISSNNITLDKILLHGVMERVLSAGYKHEVAGQTSLGSEKITIVKCTPPSTSSLHPDVTYEYVGFDENKTYRLWAAYAKPELGLPQGNLMYQITVPEAKTGVTIPADTFKL